MTDGIELDDRLFHRALGHLEKQIPFALALSLTKTAKAAQKGLKDELPRDFTLRTTWVPRGIRIKPAKKRDLEAHVGSVDENMALQARGGVRRDGAVPTKEVRKTPQTKTPRAKWPGHLAKKKRMFFGRDGRGRMTLWKRLTKKAYPIVALYRFPDKVTIPAKRWKFDDQVLETVGKAWPAEVRKAIDRILREAR
tara:strand:+ start:568 stop:1152 length:585 start_codon:yes stop_codon:yes gene_type:complete